MTRATKGLVAASRRQSAIAVFSFSEPKGSGKAGHPHKPEAVEVWGRVISGGSARRVVESFLPAARSLPAIEG